MEYSKKKIGVVIVNLDAISSQQKAHIFDVDGGFIGSDTQCSFFVQDNDKKIHDKHIKIGFEEDFFTILPVGEASVFYNGSFSKMQGGFETVVNKGDTFRISNVEFSFVDSDEIDNEMIKSKIDSFEKYDEIDDSLLQPKGKIQFDFSEKENIKELIGGKADYGFIEEKADNIFMQENSRQSPLAFDDIQNLIYQIIEELLENQQVVTLNHEYESIDVDFLEKIIASTPLVKSTKLINVLVLSLICKELYSPIFDIKNDSKENIFIEYIQLAVQKSVKEDKKIFEYLTIKSLEKYLK